jgi:hypothetical protein
MAYFLAPSLVAFRNEINAKWPNRDKSSDGWIGDPSHAARVSSHNPLWSAPGKWSGVVRAIDVDVDDRDAGTNLREEVIKAAKFDPRVWYIISSGVIYSRTNGFAARRYLGSNGHYAHVHISLRETVEAWSDTSKWFKTPVAPKWVPKVGVRSDLDLIQQQFQQVQGLRDDVRIVRYNGVGRIQQELNERGASLPVDGFVGQKTVDAWKKWEASLPASKRSGSLGTPDPKSLAPMGLIFGGPQATLPGPLKVKVRVGTHNVYVKRAPAEVNKTYSALLAKHRPHAVLLQETAQMYGKWSIPGYVVIQFAPKRINDGHVIETSSNTVLVRNDVAVKFKGLLDLDETWEGPKVGALHDPRAPITTTIEVEGKDMRLLDVHGPFGLDAVAEFNAAIVGWFETSPYPAVAAGDYNQSFDKVVTKIGTPAGALVDGKAPDMAIIKGPKKTGSANLGKQGSDTHDFKIFDYEI